MSNLLRCFGFTENRLHLGKAQASLALLSVCTVFRVSNSEYAPSFSLSAPCILLTLTRRLRFISNPYFDTPSWHFAGRLSLLPDNELEACCPLGSLDPGKVEPGVEAGYFALEFPLSDWP